MNYCIKAAIEVLNAKPLNAHDKYSFDHPSIGSDKEWKEFLQDMFDEVELLATLIEALDDSILSEN